MFSWLISSVHDDRGNVVHYEYKAEDTAGVDLERIAERHRTPALVGANRYLKRIRYGNRVSRLVDPDLDAPTGRSRSSSTTASTTRTYRHPARSGPWDCRLDPFSSYRAGFEVRTYRLCRRVLMFHHFPDEPGVGVDCLVASTDLSYSRRPGPDAACRR